MRNPKKAIDKLPLHKPVGQRVAAAIDGFLDKHPHLEDGIQRIITSNDPHAKGPTDIEIAAARHVVDEALEVDRQVHSLVSRTALDATIYEAWIQLSHGPDVHIPQWLTSGTPMGIREQPISVAVFPESFEKVPDDLRRSVEAFGESFVNYSSLEDSPYSKDVLGGACFPRFHSET